MARRLLIISVLIALSLSLAINPTPQQFPKSLSSKAQGIHTAVLDQIKSNGATPIPTELIPASADYITQYIDYGDAARWSSIYDSLITSAQEEIVLASFVYITQSNLAKQIATSLTTLDARLSIEKKRVRMYIQYDRVGTRYFRKTIPKSWESFTQKLMTPNLIARESIPLSKLGIPTLRNIDVRIKSFHRGLFGCFHDKYVIIDGKDVLLGSKNIDDDTSEEYMLHLRGSVATSLRDMYFRAWFGRSKMAGALASKLDGVVPTLTAPHVGKVPVMVVGRSATRWRKSWSTSPDIANPQATAWLKALDVAQTSVYIQSMSFNENTIVSKVLNTIKERGIKVTISTTYNQGPFETSAKKLGIKTNRETAKWMYSQLPADKRHLLRICWWMGPRNTEKVPNMVDWSHSKALIVDEEIAIIGSANHDAFSWYHQHEFEVVIDDKEIAGTILKGLSTHQISLDPSYCTHQE